MFFFIFELRENPLPSNKRKMIATKMICYVICLETAHVASIIVEEQKEGMYYIFLKTIFRPFLFDFCSNLVFICNTKSQIAFFRTIKSCIWLFSNNQPLLSTIAYYIDSFK